MFKIASLPMEKAASSSSRQHLTDLENNIDTFYFIIQVNKNLFTDFNRGYILTFLTIRLWIISQSVLLIFSPIQRVHYWFSITSNSTKELTLSWFYIENKRGSLENKNRFWHVFTIQKILDSISTESLQRNSLLKAKTNNWSKTV